MIGWLKGVVRARTDDGLVLDVAGVGYDVTVSALTAASLPAQGRETELHVHTQVREDAITLYGFAELGERIAFRVLLGVAGVGPRLAISVLSTWTAGQLALAVAGGDVRRLAQVPGIGKKMAERLVVELKDRLPQALAEGPLAPPGSVPVASPAAPGSPAVQDVQLALLSLGYRKPEIDRILKGIVVGPDDTVEALLRRALKDLGIR